MIMTGKTSFCQHTKQKKQFIGKIDKFIFLLLEKKKRKNARKCKKKRREVASLTWPSTTSPFGFENLQKFLKEKFSELV